MTNSTHAYANTWDGFVGQDLAKRQIRTAITSSRMRNAKLDHILLASGSPGVGKTNLAHLIAGELGGTMHEITGKIKPNEARSILSDMDDGDLLFYDELHTAVAGAKSGADWLLTFLQDGCIPGPRGMEPCPSVTVIGATTDAGRLPETVLSRFIKPKLVPYTQPEATLIAQALSCRIIEFPLPVATKSCEDVALAAVRNPRTMREIWAVVRDIALAGECENVVHTADGADYDIGTALEMLGLTPDGLNEVAQRYLICMKDSFGGLAGKTAIADAMREPGGLAHCERVLVDLGFLTYSKQGRALTMSGNIRAKKLMKAMAV